MERVLNFAKVRLSKNTLQDICNIFSEVFPAGDKLWIFGSRTDKTGKGGDIDLYVETVITSPEAVVKTRLRFLTKLKLKIGDQKIDVVIRYGNDDYMLIHKIAKKKGVRLV